MRLILIFFMLLCSCEGDYYNSSYYQENSFYESCIKEGRTQTECDLLYQEKQTLKAEEAAANRMGYDD